MFSGGFGCAARVHNLKTTAATSPRHFPDGSAPKVIAKSPNNGLDLGAEFHQLVVF